MIGADLALVGVTVVVASDALFVAKILVQPRLLVLLMILNLALLAYRVWAADDAYRSAKAAGAAGVRLAPVGIGLIVGAILLIPHAALAYYDIVQYNLIATNFAAEDVAAPPATTLAPATGSGSPSTTFAGVTRAPGPAIWDGLERLNVLLLGSDAGRDRRAIRTDTMIVVSIDPVTGDAAMLGVPRNFARVPLPEGHGVWGDCQCFPRLLNDLYYAGTERPSAFPGPGTPEENAIKGGIGELLGIEIHYYALVTLDGFVGVIDALGGVDINVPVRIVDEEYPHEDGVTREFVDIQPGLQHLDGHFALAYARIRRHADDYARMNRQRCVLEAVLEQSNPVELLFAYPRIAGVLSDALQTDIPISRLPDFIDLLPKIDGERIVTLRFIPPTYLAGFDANGNNTPDVDRIRQDVQTVLSLSPADAVAALGISALEDACPGQTV